MQNWNSIYDGNPKKKGWYMIFCGDMSERFIRHGFRYFRGSKWAQCSDITHWAELPSEPKMPSCYCNPSIGLLVSNCPKHKE